MKKRQQHSKCQSLVGEKKKEVKMKKKKGKEGERKKSNPKGEKKNLTAIEPQKVRKKSQTRSQYIRRERD